MARRTFQASINNLTYKLRKFKDILEDSLLECIQQDEGVIINLVQQQQLYDHGLSGKSGGVWGRGIEIMSYAPYAPRTIKNKKKAGQPYDRVTLKKTGKFYNGMYVHVDEDGFSVESSDSKTDLLTAKYGREILRLSDMNFKWYLNFLRQYRLKPILKAKIMEGVK